jgi:Coenzyme PQQ synthesis protein D (PqqD)
MPADWPTGDARPRRREGASAVELDDNLALYDDVGQLLILLNASAASVWELCDGVTTLDDMVRTLVDSHDEDAGLIEVDVHQVVRKLTDLGLVVDVAEDGESEDGEAGDGEAEDGEAVAEG